MQTRRSTPLLAGFCLLALTLLWVFPLALFPNPGANDAIVLASAGPLILLGVLVLSALSLVPVAGGRLAAEVPVSLGTLIFGSGLAALLGLVAFGNLTEDRFMPLLFLPWLLVPVGFGVGLAGFLLRRHRAGELGAALLKGAAAVALVGAWLLGRGARDWVLAPYGFDWFLLIAAAGAMLALTALPAKRPTGRRV